MKVSVVKPAPPPPPQNEIQLSLTMEEARTLRSILGGIKCPREDRFRKFILDCYDELGKNGAIYNYTTPFDVCPEIRTDATI